jgi:hypothetical protein
MFLDQSMRAMGFVDLQAYLWWSRLDRAKGNVVRYMYNVVGVLFDVSKLGLWGDY